VGIKAYGFYCIFADECSIGDERVGKRCEDKCGIVAKLERRVYDKRKDIRKEVS
jgi:hypothetical protein